MMCEYGSNTAPDIDHSDEEFNISDDYSWLFTHIIEEDEDEEG